MAIGLKLKNVLYVIHAVPPERLRPLLPPGIELDLRPTPDGERAFIATVTLESGAAFPYVMSAFRQVAYRVLVLHGDEPGLLLIRSWVSARAAAAVLSLAVPTEHASVDITIADTPRPYARYQVEAASDGHRWAVDAAADDSIDLGVLGTPDETVHFLTHRLNAFVAGAHPQAGLAVVRVSHPPMQPLPARVRSAVADQWTLSGVLTADEVSHPFLALIQPETQFDMNLPEKLRN